LPALQVAPALSTLGKSVQSLPQAPQLCTSVEVETQVVPQVVCPLGQAHDPHWHAVEHVSLAPATLQF
jgi:hypothetical protein